MDKRKISEINRRTFSNARSQTRRTQRTRKNSSLKMLARQPSVSKVNENIFDGANILYRCARGIGCILQTEEESREKTNEEQSQLTQSGGVADTLTHISDYQKRKIAKWNDNFVWNTTSARFARPFCTIATMRNDEMNAHRLYLLFT